MPKRYPGLARHGGKRIGAGRKRKVVNREFIRARVRAIRYSPRNGTFEREFKILRHIFLNHKDSVGLEAGLALLKLPVPKSCEYLRVGSKGHGVLWRLPAGVPQEPGCDYERAG